MNIKDITIFYPLKRNGVYKPFAYSFNSIVTSFSNAKDAFDFIKASYLTEKECQDMCVLLNKATKIWTDYCL